MIDLRKFALRLKIIEMLRNLTGLRIQRDTTSYWRHWIHPN